MDNLWEKHQKEIQLAKDSLADLYEKKVQYLQESKEEYEMRLAKTEKLLKEKDSELQEILVEYWKIEKLADQEVGQLWLDIRLKTDEVMRITHLYEDNLLLVKELKIENESIKQKQDLLKSEYYKLESSARTKSADIVAELALYKERVSQYESLEKDLDDIIVQTAEST